MAERPIRELTGRIAPQRIAQMSLPPLPADAVAALRALDGPTGAVSDALDHFGVGGAIGSRDLQPSIQGACIVGRALTLRNVAREGAAHVLAREGRNLVGEMEAHNLAEPGDVIVIQGVAGCSNMGGIGPLIGLRQGEVGAIVDGGVRDIAESRRAGYPIWSAARTPMTGKWRLETAEINGPVEIGGVRVEAGDLVVADDTGVCFVPRLHVAEVVAYAIGKDRAEREKAAEIGTGLSVPQLAGQKP